MLLDPTFFSANATLSKADTHELTALAQRWRGHVTSGAFRIPVSPDIPMGTNAPSVNFWTTQYAYADLPAVDPTLLAELQKSDLVVFKGDLK